MHLFRFSTSVTHVVAVTLHSKLTTGARVALICRLLCSRRQFQILPVACVGLHLHVDHAASGDRVL